MTSGDNGKHWPTKNTFTLKAPEQALPRHTDDLVNLVRSLGALLPKRTRHWLRGRFLAAPPFVDHFVFSISFCRATA